MNSKFYIQCPWCGNTWEQEEEEPRRCEVCQHYSWEGTDEVHMMFPDLEIWRKYEEKIDKK